jgi:hypothetical protein
MLVDGRYCRVAQFQLIVYEGQTYNSSPECGCSPANSPSAGISRATGKTMSLGPSLASGADAVKSAAKPRPRSAVNPWYSPSQPRGADRRSNEPAKWVCWQSTPPLPEWGNQASADSLASPGRSLRRLYQLTPTVPCESTAIEGSNAKALTRQTDCPLQPQQQGPAPLPMEPQAQLRAGASTGVRSGLQPPPPPRPQCGGS